MKKGHLTDQSKGLAEITNSGESVRFNKNTAILLHAGMCAWSRYRSLKILDAALDVMPYLPMIRDEVFDKLGREEREPFTIESEQESSSEDENTNGQPQYHTIKSQKSSKSIFRLIRDDVSISISLAPHPSIMTSSSTLNDPLVFDVL